MSDLNFETIFVCNGGSSGWELGKWPLFFFVTPGRTRNQFLGGNVTNRFLPSTKKTDVGEGAERELPYCQGNIIIWENIQV